jgi:methylaspartate mutase epsilon subunit
VNDLGGRPDRSFGGFVARAREAGELIVQPRMGMSSPVTMRAGLIATKNAAATTVGTITLDSYTRTGQDAKAKAALESAADLNGYPIVAHDAVVTRAVLDGVADLDFPVQIRHGSPCPENIFRALTTVGLHATEGGPVSYCLPYSRTPLSESIDNWARCCELLAELSPGGIEPHLESFGGCMLGQLCPPSMLIAISVLECMFFRQHGLRSMSLSYAQQTSPAQDREAVLALRRLAAELLPDVDWHIVIYAYMGVLPRPTQGATALLTEAARLSVRTGSERLIVKTTAEAHRIPTIADNVDALEAAAAAAADERRHPGGPPVEDTGIYAEALALVTAVASLHDDLGRAFGDAFRLGYLDIPYCLHPDNAGRTRARIDGDGRLNWTRIGSMPISEVVAPSGAAEFTSAELLTALSHVERKFDDAGLAEYLGKPDEPADRAQRELKEAT